MSLRGGDGGGGGDDGFPNQSTPVAQDALQYVVQTVSESVRMMQDTMMTMIQKMERTDDVVRGVERRLNEQGKVVAKIGNRMDDLRELLRSQDRAASVRSISIDNSDISPQGRHDSFSNEGHLSFTSSLHSFSKDEESSYQWNSRTSFPSEHPALSPCDSRAFAPTQVLTPQCDLCKALPSAHNSSHSDHQKPLTFNAATQCDYRTAFVTAQTSSKPDCTALSDREHSSTQCNIRPAFANDQQSSQCHHCTSFPTNQDSSRQWDHVTPSTGPQHESYNCDLRTPFPIPHRSCTHDQHSPSPNTRGVSTSVRWASPREERSFSPGQRPISTRDRCLSPQDRHSLSPDHHCSSTRDERVGSLSCSLCLGLCGEISPGRHRSSPLERRAEFSHHHHHNSSPHDTNIFSRSHQCCDHAAPCDLRSTSSTDISYPSDRHLLPDGHRSSRERSPVSPHHRLPSPSDRSPISSSERQSTPRKHSANSPCDRRSKSSENLCSSFLHASRPSSKDERCPTITHFAGNISSSTQPIQEINPSYPLFATRSMEYESESSSSLFYSSDSSSSITSVRPSAIQQTASSRRTSNYDSPTPTHPPNVTTSKFITESGAVDSSCPPHIPEAIPGAVSGIIEKSSVCFQSTSHTRLHTASRSGFDTFSPASKVRSFANSINLRSLTRSNLCSDSGFIGAPSFTTSTVPPIVAPQSVSCSTSNLVPSSRARPCVSLQAVSNSGTSCVWPPRRSSSLSRPLKPSSLVFCSPLHFQARSSSRSHVSSSVIALSKIPSRFSDTKVRFTSKSVAHVYPPLPTGTESGNLSIASTHTISQERAKQLAVMGRNLLAMCHEGKTNGVRLLLDAGVCVNYSNSLKWTPLHKAAAKNHVDIVDLLLKRGANVTATTCYGFTPLHIATYNDRNGQCVARLIEGGSDVDIGNRSGRTPLHTAVECGNVTATNLLLAAGADRSIQDDKGNSPLDVAKKLGLRRLLQADTRDL